MQSPEKFNTYDSKVVVDEFDKLCEDPETERWGWGDIDINTASGIVRSNPDLARQYFSFLKRKPNHFDSVFTLLGKAPDYAEKLKSVFEEVPELMRVYAYWSSSLKDIRAEGKEEDLSKQKGRILPSLNPEVVRGHLKRNAEFVAKLAAKNGKLEEAGVALLFENDADAEIRIIKLESGVPDDENDGVEILLTPSNSEFDFPTWSIKITKYGLIDVRRSMNEWQNLGYLFQDRILDEEFLIKTLTEYESYSKELTEKLEGNQTILDYILKQGGPTYLKKNKKS